jgi:hypothetical protein
MNMLMTEKGMPAETVSEITGLDLKTVERLAGR